MNIPSILYPYDFLLSFEYGNSLYSLSIFVSLEQSSTMQSLSLWKTIRMSDILRNNPRVLIYFTFKAPKVVRFR